MLRKGERYVEIGGDMQAWNAEHAKQSYNTPTDKEWEWIEEFWKGLVMKYGSLAKAFRQMDLNRNGSLSCIEFQEGCRANNIDITSGDAAKLFRLFDGDRSGEITVAEFTGSRLLRADPEAEAQAEAKSQAAKKAEMEAKAKSTGTSASDRRNFTGDPADPETFWAFLRLFFPEKAPGLSYARAFRQIDINKNGDLSQSEFVAGLQSIKFPGQRWQWKKLFFTLDDDQDGEIGIGEFSNWEAPECRKKTATTSMLGGARYQKALREEMDRIAKAPVLMESAKHSTLLSNTKLGDFAAVLQHNQRYGTQEAVILPGQLEGDGWQRVYGTVMRMQRPDRCQRVRDGLDRLAEERVRYVKQAKGTQQRSLSPRRATAPRRDDDRQLPNLAVFRSSPIPKFPFLPMCSMLEHSASEDLSVWRRPTYD